MSLSFETNSSDDFTNFSTNFSQFEQLKKKKKTSYWSKIGFLLNEVEKEIIINMH